MNTTEPKDNGIGVVHLTKNDKEEINKIRIVRRYPLSREIYSRIRRTREEGQAVTTRR